MSVLMKPTTDDFAMEILQDLVSQGYGGEELIKKFAEQRANIRKAIGIMLSEADDITRGKQKSATTEEIFGEM